LSELLAAAALHVYASSADKAVGAFGMRTDLMPRGGFFHAWTEHEGALRAEFKRVHSCRRFSKRL